jgi:hypothetical protein
MVSDELCEVCVARSRAFISAVTRDEGDRPVCFAHAPASYRDEQTVIRALTSFITWHEERAATIDGTVVEARREKAKDKNRALAMAHRRAAEAIRESIRAATAKAKKR